MRDKQLTLRITEEKRLAFAAYAERNGTTTSKILTDFIDRCLEEAATEIESESLTQRIDALESRLNERLDRLEAAILEAKGDATAAVTSATDVATELETLAARLGELVAAKPVPAAIVAIEKRKEAARLEARRLRGAGKNWNQVASDLNSRSIPTPSGKGEWRGNMVQRLLDE